MDQQHNERDAFESVSQANRVVRTARMLNEDTRLERNQRKDIIERTKRFMKKWKYTQVVVAREVGIGSSTLSEILGGEYSGKVSEKSIDAKIAKLHNWLELTARRRAITDSREFVTTSVAREILTVAEIVAETCKMGVIYGPAQIGKSITLNAIVGDQAFGDPTLITVNESNTRPVPLCREICAKFDLSVASTFDRLFRRLVNRLKGTKRMIMFDEADLATYSALEMIRQLHDATGCPILFSGKPKIYEHLGLRDMGEFSEKLDQMAGRMAVRRDLTERTRGKDGEDGEPLFSMDDIRNLIKQSGISLKVDGSARKWLQDRSSTLGMGGWGKAMISLYLAFKVAFVNGDEVITADHLDDVDELTAGNEDAELMSEITKESSSMRRVV